MKAIQRSALMALVPSVGAIIGYVLARESGEPWAFGRFGALLGLTFGTSFGLAFALLKSGAITPSSTDEKQAPEPPSERTTVISSLLSFVGMGAIGWFVASRWGTPIAESLSFDLGAVTIGFASALPPIAMLHVIMTSQIRPIRAFRDKQIKLFVDRNFDVSWPTVIAISLGAGIGEEILFRGALQPLLQGWTTPLLGLLLASALFGLAHAANWTYIAITGAVGLFLGFIFLVTENLIAPMIGHAVYDVYALAVTVKAVREFKAASL